MENASLATTVRSLREAQGLSQAALAARARVTRYTVDAIERGRSLKPGYDKLLRMADVLGNLDRVLGAAGYMAPGGQRRGPENFSDLMERLRLTAPIVVPIYNNYPVGEEAEPDRYSFMAKSAVLSEEQRGCRGYVVQGDGMAPAVVAGDVVSVAPSLEPWDGALVVGEMDGKMVVGKYRRSQRRWVENATGKYDAGRMARIEVVFHLERIFKYRG